MAHVTAEARPSRAKLPRPIRRALRRVDLRLRALAAMRGLGTAGLVAALGALTGMGADFIWGLPPLARWGIWLAWVLAFAAPLALVLRRVLMSRTEPMELAAVIERGDPSLGERLTGAVDLLGAHAHGSPALIAALAEDASARARGIDPVCAASSKRAWRRLALGFSAVALVAAPALVKPEPFGTLARRFLNPWADLDRVGLYAVTVDPGDVVVAIGDDLTIAAQVAPRFGRSPAQGDARLEYTDAASGRVRRLAMTEAEGARSDSGARAFSIVLPRLTGSLTYRVASRSGESRRFRVTAAPAPSVSGIVARVEPPVYTKFPGFDARNPARIEAWEDSRVTLTVGSTKALSAAEVSWPLAGKKPEEGAKAKPESLRVPARLSADGKTATFDLLAESTGDYMITLRDTLGLKSRAEAARRIRVRPDEPPVLAVKGTGGLDVAKADDTLRMAFAARDDVAVDSAELHYSIDRAAGSPGAGSEAAEAGQAVAKGAGLGTSSARGELAVALKTLKVRTGDVLSYRVRVADNRPAPRGPNVVWSSLRRLTIVAKADPLWARRGQAGRESLQKTLDALKKAAVENRQQAEQLRYAADAVQRGNGKWEADRQEGLAKREAEAGKLVDQLQEFARDLAADPAFRPLSRPARQVAEVEAEAARAALDQARQDHDDGKRFNDLRQADTRLGAVSNRLEELQRDLNALAEQEADHQRLQALADRQAQLAEKAEAAKSEGNAPPDRIGLDQIAAEQNAVKNELDALLKKSPALRDDVLAAQADEAEALARRAREVAERQRVESRKATDLSKKTKALMKLAEEQRALEEDARRLALDVDRPLAENGRGPLNIGPIHQAADPIARGELDQGRQHLEGAEAELRRLARDLVEAPDDLKALARRLVAKQEQINNDVAAALGEARNKDHLPEQERNALAKMLQPQADRQRSVAKLAAAILASKEAKAANAEPKFPRDQAKQARNAAERAEKAIRKPDNPREVEAFARESREALERLANELPDPWKREEPTRQAFAEARRTADEVFNQVERHLRETDRPHEKDFTPARGASELAERLGPLGEQALQAAKRLEAVEPLSRIKPQHDRAAHRARALAAAIEAARAQAPKPNEAAGFDADNARAFRDALAASALETRHAFERIEQKLNNGAPADELARELAGEQRALGKAGEPGPARAENQRRIATALRNLRVPDAALEQAEAVRLAERAARALADNEPGKASDEALGKASEAAAALADRLNDRQTPRARAQALARAERGMNDPDIALNPLAEAARQRALAAELARIGPARPDAAGATPATAPASEAIRNAEELAARLSRPEEAIPGQGKPTPAQQADARAQAAKALDALAARLPDNLAPVAANKPANQGRPPVDPELALDADHAARAKDLVRRERHVKEKLQAVMGERVAPQQDIRRDSMALAGELADLRDRAAGVSERSRGPAEQAVSLLGEQAPQAMNEAVGQLTQAQASPAREAQRRAADLAERGAQNVEDLAAALRSERLNEAAPAANAEAKHQADPSALAAARDAMSQASQALSQARGQAAPKGQSPLANARQAMKGAADQLQAAAEKAQAGAGESAEGEPGEAAEQSLAQASASDSASKSEPDGGKAGVANPDPLRDLQEQIRRKTGRKWGELPGHLRGEILQMSQGRYRDDYARLIQLYFREIAAGADAKP